MKLTIVPRGVDRSDALRVEISERLDDAVGAYAANVDWVVVALVRTGAGPVSCSVDMGLLPHGRLRFEESTPVLRESLREATREVSYALGPFIDSVLSGGEPVVPKDPPRGPDTSD